MESAGYVVKGFASAEDFLAVGSFRDAACLIVDVQMPGITRLELQDKLAGADNPVPIVFVGAPGNARESRKGDSAGRGRFS
jgi:FixJ family two-component response regulator